MAESLGTLVLGTSGTGHSESSVFLKAALIPCSSSWNLSDHDAVVSRHLRNLLDDRVAQETHVSDRKRLESRNRAKPQAYCEARAP